MHRCSPSLVVAFEPVNAYITFIDSKFNMSVNRARGTSKSTLADSDRSDLISRMQHENPKSQYSKCLFNRAGNIKFPMTKTLFIPINYLLK
jgi:hypothetical protein